MERFTTRPELRGHLRHGRLDALARLGRRDVDARARRQRLRRGGGGRVRAAGGRAAPERARRRGADPALQRRARRGARDRRPGHGTGRGDDRRAFASSATSSCREPGCSRPACPGRSTPGCCSCRSSGRCRWRTCWSRRSATRRAATRWCPGSARTSPRMEQVFREEWPVSAELYLPVPKPGTLFRNPAWPRPTGACSPSRTRGADRGRPRRFYRGFVAEAIVEAGSLLSPGERPRPAQRRRPRGSRPGRAAGPPLRG